MSESSPYPNSVDPNDLIACAKCGHVYHWQVFTDCPECNEPFCRDCFEDHRAECAGGNDY